VEVEVEYDDIYDNVFNQFTEMFDDEDKNKLEKMPNTDESEEEEEVEYVDDEDYASVEQLIPTEMKAGCNAETFEHQKYVTSHFKKLRKFPFNFSVH
jgi:hypothetical protein